LQAINNINCRGEEDEGKNKNKRIGLGDKTCINEERKVEKHKLGVTRVV